MHAQTRLRILNLCSWGGIAALTITLIGWLMAGLLPLPLGPSDSPAHVVEFYSTHHVLKMSGFVVATLGVSLLMPLVGVITIHMMRVEGRTPVLSLIQLGVGSITMLINLMPSMLFCVLTFRPELRSAESMVLLNDLTWLIFFTPIVPFMIQNVAIALVVLTDPNQYFPRWVGWTNLLVAFAFVPDVLAYFFLDGPFAWNGIFVFWLALTAYAVFLVVMSVVTRRLNPGLVGQLGADAVSGTRR